MDDNEGGEPIEQFHRNEAISAVADDGFLGEEEDDDYEDLYNDVNVGENFLQSLRKNDEVERKPEPVPPAASPQLPPPPVVAESSRGNVQGELKKEEDVVSGVSARASVGAPAGSGVSGGGGGGGGFRVEFSNPPSGNMTGDLEERIVSSSVPNQGMVQQQPHTGGGVGAVGNAGNVGNSGNDILVRQGGGVNVNGAGNVVVGGGGVSAGGGGGGGGGGAILFVGDLHWWTTDAELEGELSKYGLVKEVKFFEEKASGKSKGYCQVEFHDSSAASACKEGMNGHVFNGRPCVVAFASSPYNVKRMGEAQANRNQQQMGQTAAAPQARRGPGEPAGKIGNNNTATGGNFQGGGDGNRGGYGRGNWGRGGGPQGMGNRGPMGPMRNRPGGMAGRGMMGNGGGGFGQGMGAAPPLMHPQAMMGQGFEPGFGGPMGRMGGYGGFPGGPAPPFPGMMSSFPPVGGVGMPGVAPHVNPAFFGRGMPMNGMGMMPGAGMEGPNMGMWSDPNMGGGWGGDEHGGGRAGESSYAEEAGSDHQYGEVSHDRGAWPNNLKEKDRGSERDWSGSTDRKHRDDREPAYDRDVAREKDRGHDHDWSERRHRDDRDVPRERERDRDRERSRERGRDRDRHRDERDRYADHHRYKDREQEYDDEDRGRSSRGHSKSRLSHEDDHRSRSRDADYGKRRRITSE